jgi:hypothetical protein
MSATTRNAVIRNVVNMVEVLRRRCRWARPFRSRNRPFTAGLCFFRLGIFDYASIMSARTWLRIAAIWFGLGLFEAIQTVLVMRSEGMHHTWSVLFGVNVFSWVRGRSRPRGSFASVDGFRRSPACVRRTGPSISAHASSSGSRSLRGLLRSNYFSIRTRMWCANRTLRCGFTDSQAACSLRSFCTSV